jgi:hypothetical protein
MSRENITMSKLNVFYMILSIIEESIESQLSPKNLPITFYFNDMIEYFLDKYLFKFPNDIPRKMQSIIL